MSIINGDARDMDPSRFAPGGYQTIIADCPWRYGERRLRCLNGSSPRFGVGAEGHYQGTMTTDEICAMPVGKLAASRCHLYLWTTGPFLPDSIRVMESWGFKYTTIMFVWIKVNPGAWKDAQIWLRAYRETGGLFEPSFDVIREVLDAVTKPGVGYYTLSNAELLLLGWSGEKPFKHAEGQKARQVIYTQDGYVAIIDEPAVFAPLGPHSEKPEVFQDLIEWMYPQAVPRLELFARRPRKNWDSFGNELGQYEEEKNEKITGTVDDNLAT